MIDDGKEIAVEARPPDSVVDVFGISIQQGSTCHIPLFLKKGMNTVEGQTSEVSAGGRPTGAPRTPQNFIKTGASIFRRQIYR